MRCAPFALFIGLIVMAAPVLGDVTYTIVDLGTLYADGSGLSVGRGINDAGQVVGISFGPFGTHGFRTSPNSVINGATDDLGPAGDFGNALAINASGQTVGGYGISVTATGLITAGYRTTAAGSINPATSNIGSLGGMYVVPASINQSGQVAGFSSLSGDSSGPVRAFRTAANAAINPATDNLGSLVAGLDSFGNGINNNGQVVGTALTTPRVPGTASSIDGTPHAFRTAAGAAINSLTDDLGTLGGLYSWGMGINSSGRAVGYSSIDANYHHAFLTGPNGMISPANDLGTLGGHNSEGYAVNDAGQVVGLSEIALSSAVEKAFLYSGGQMRSLESLIDPSLGWQISEVHDINNLGQIVGYGTIGGHGHAFLMTPTPEPSLVAPIGSLIAFGRLRRNSSMRRITDERLR